MLLYLIILPVSQRRNQTLILICIVFLIQKYIDLSLRKLLNFCTKLGTWLVRQGMFMIQFLTFTIQTYTSIDWLSILTYFTILSHSLKKLLHSKAEAFLSNDYYESDIAWMDLVSLFSPFMVRNFALQLLSVLHHSYGFLLLRLLIIFCRIQSWILPLVHMKRTRMKSLGTR